MYCDRHERSRLVSFAVHGYNSRWAQTLLSRPKQLQVVRLEGVFWDHTTKTNCSTNWGFRTDLEVAVCLERNNVVSVSPIVELKTPAVRHRLFTFCRNLSGDISWVALTIVLTHSSLDGKRNLDAYKFTVFYGRISHISANVFPNPNPNCITGGIPTLCTLDQIFC